jgi:hypothetical protein
MKSASFIVTGSEKKGTVPGYTVSDTLVSEIRRCTGSFTIKGGTIINSILALNTYFCDIIKQEDKNEKDYNCTGYMLKHIRPGVGCLRHRQTRACYGGAAPAAAPAPAAGK